MPLSLFASKIIAELFVMKTLSAFKTSISLNLTSHTLMFNFFANSISFFLVTPGKMLLVKGVVIRVLFFNLGHLTLNTQMHFF